MTVAQLKAQTAKKVAIVCGAPSSENLAPFDDPSWEIWVLGNRLDRHKGRRVSKIFEIHDDLSEHGDVAAYTAWLVSQDIPMVVGEKFPLKAPHVQVFPFAQVNAMYGSEYLTSSPAYMMGLACLEGAAEIGIYGVDLSIDDMEYRFQRAAMESWVGFAKGRGIKVTIAEQSSLGKAAYVEGRAKGGKPQFAKPPFTEAEFLAVAEMHAKRIEEKSAQIRALEDSIHIHSGAQQAYQRLAKVARAIETGIEVSSLTETVRLA